MMRFGSGTPMWVALGIVAGFVFTGIVAIFAGFGFAAYLQNVNENSPTRQPSFFRMTMGNCMDAFFCMNETAPNPSYVQWNTPPFEDISLFTREFSDVMDVFDISDPEIVRIRKNGVYAFTVFTPVFSPLGDGEAAFVMTQNELPILQSPAIGGLIAHVNLLTLFQDGIGNISAALFTYSSAGIYLTSGTELRVAYKVAGEETMLITPGSYWSGFRVSDFSI